MSNATVTGNMSTLFGKDKDIYNDAVTTTRDYFEQHINNSTIFEAKNSFKFSTQTATLIEGYDPGSQDTITLVGTNFLGVGGEITHGEFVGDDGGGVLFDGKMTWILDDDIKGGPLTLLDITAVDGSRLVAEGVFNMKQDGTIRGTIHNETITTADGFSLELTGNFRFGHNAGSISKIVLDDGGGDTFVMTGRFGAKSFFNTFDNIDNTTIEDVFAFGLSRGDQITGSAGNDVLQGFKGSDVLSGLAGNDILEGGAGRDRLTGGDDVDTFLYASTADAGSSANYDIITDFTAGPGGDTIDISSILTGYAGGTVASFVLLTEMNGDTILSVDMNGAAGGSKFYKIATLDGVTGLDADQMVLDGNLIV